MHLFTERMSIVTYVYLVKTTAWCGPASSFWSLAPEAAISGWTVLRTSHWWKQGSDVTQSLLPLHTMLLRHTPKLVWPVQGWDLHYAFISKFTVK